MLKYVCAVQRKKGEWEQDDDKQTLTHTYTHIIVKAFLVADMETGGEGPSSTLQGGHFASPEGGEEPKIGDLGETWRKKRIHQNLKHT